MAQIPQMRDPLTYAIIGAAQFVHRELGPGFLERPYEEALALVLQGQGHVAERQVELGILFCGKMLEARYRADLLVDGRVLVELKAASSLGPPDEAQLLHYLKASGIPVGLLLNFGARSLEHRRMVWRWTGESAPSAESAVRQHVTAAGADAPAPPPTPTSGTTPAP
jgi:GxxExxY protein